MLLANVFLASTYIVLTESSSHRGSRNEEAHAKQKFVSLVEAGDEKRDSTIEQVSEKVWHVIRSHLRHDTSFKYTEKSSCNHES